MKGIVKFKELGNGYIVVIQDQFEHHGKKTYNQMIMRAKNKPVFITHDLIRYKAIVLVDGSYLESKGNYGVTSDTNCKTLKEANKIFNKYVIKYKTKTL